MHPRSPSLLGRLAHLAQHPWRRQGLAVEAILTLALVKLVLSTVRFARWRRWLAIDAAPGPRRLPRERVAEVVWAVDRASQPFPKAFSCLPRALATQAMLRRRGSGGTLAIGVAKEAEGPFSAHAWIELDGEVLIGDVPGLARYQRLSGWPGEQGR